MSRSRFLAVLLASLTVTATAVAADLPVIVHGEPRDVERALLRAGSRRIQRIGPRHVAARVPAGRIAWLRAELDVGALEEDAVLRTSVTPNDPSYGQQYGLAKTSCPAAWDVTKGTGATLVAVIDTGVDYTHPDLAANIFTNPREVAGNGVDDDGNGFIDDVRGWDFFAGDNNPSDENGHGTHVAGTIGAVGNNGVGVAGVCWTTKIVPLRFLGPNGSGATSAAVGCINYARNIGAPISNNSWGGGGFSQSLFDAIRAARDAGHIFVAAAGNEGRNTDTTPSYPAGYALDNIVSVAATDSNDALASFSNRGTASVDLAAPGVSILSTTRNNTYSSFSGTSMATPHVSGALALARDASPTLGYAALIARLLEGVDPIPGLPVASGGRLNVARTVPAAVVPPPSTDPPPPPSVVTRSYTWSGALSIIDFFTSIVNIGVADRIRVQDINVTITLRHTYVADLRIIARSPGGTNVTLSNRRGGSGDNFTGTTFDDEATQAISAGRAPFSGSFRPDSPLTAYDGPLAQGTWQLRVTDNGFLDMGTITSVTITITGTLEP